MSGAKDQSLSLKNKNKAGKCDSDNKEVLRYEERNSNSDAGKEIKSQVQGELKLESNFSSIVGPGRNSDANKVAMQESQGRVSDMVANTLALNDEVGLNEGLTTDRDMNESFDFNQTKEDDIRENELPPMLIKLREYQEKRN